jgi:hypothetical protein
MTKLKTDYNLGKSFEEKFEYLCRELYPNLNISKIDRKGRVVIKESESIFPFRKRVKKHITEVLQHDITAAIALKFFGNLDLVGFYDDKVMETFSSNEIDNIKRAILMLHAEYTNRELSNMSIGLPINNGVSTRYHQLIDAIEAEEPQEQPKGTAYFVDFIFQPAKLKQNIKNYMLASALTTGMILTRSSSNILTFLYNNCRGRPPIHIPYIYDTS